MAGFMQSSLSDLAQPLGAPVYERMVDAYLMTSLPVMVTGVVVAIGFSLAQSQGYFNLEKLAEPKLDNLINPLKGIKDLMLSKKALIQLLFSCFKILVIGGMCAWVIMGWLDGFVSAEPYSLGGIMEGTKDVAMELAIKVGIAFLLIAIIDYIIKWFEIEEQLKMSHKEIKDEHKSTEGDPQQKGRRRQMARDLVDSRSVKNVVEADVVVVNPTHYAVAISMTKAWQLLRFWQRWMNKAELLDCATKLYPAFRNHHWPELFTDVKVGKEVPSISTAVALVLAHVYKRNGKNKRRAS